MQLPGSTGHAAPEYTASMLKLAILILTFTTIMFTLFVPAHVEAGQYEKEINAIQNDYYMSTGQQATANTEIWPLVGIYTPYSGEAYGTTPDGWIYGSKVVNYSPSQYATDPNSNYSVRLMDNGLYYYTSVASNDLTHHDSITGEPKVATQNNDTWDYSNAAIYSEVSMSNAYKSDIFLTPDGKTSDGEHFWYNYSGYRYAFAPIRAYQIDDGGTIVTVQPQASSLSLVWYQYSTLTGVAGMLSINGSDQGLSYLTGADILREFNGATYSSVFDMTFSSIKMHLTIKLDANKITAGLSPETCYNEGFWTVIVTSDAVTSANVTNPTYEFNFDNIFNTLIALFSFDLAGKYDISGWEATVVSLLVTMPLWAALLSLAISNYYILIGVALLAIFQGISGAISNLVGGGGWWPF